MATDLLKTLIDDINGRLNGVDAFRAINYMPEKMRTVGDTLLKAFCPFHHPSDPNEKIPTLTVNLQNKTFQCLKRGCEGNAGGSLIDLYARSRRVSPLQAAVELARLTGVEVEEDQLTLVGRLAFDEARDKRSAGSAPADCLIQCEFALSILPDHLEALKLKAALCDDLDRREDALNTVLKIVNLCEANDKPVEALEAIETLVLPKDGHNESALLQAARLHEKLGGIEQAIGYYLRVADDRDEMNREEENLDLLQRMVELAPQRLDLRSRLAKLYETLGESSKAAGEYDVLAAAYEKNKELKPAIESLQRLITLCPDDLPLKERLARLLQQSGDSPAALEIWLAAAAAWQTGDKWDDALRCAGKALEIQPDSMPAARRKGEILQAAGRTDAARDHYMSMFESLDQRGEPGEAYAVLRLARDCAPHDAAVQRQITAWLTEQHRVDEAIDEMFQLVRILMDSKNTDEGFATLRQISLLQPKNKVVRLRVAEICVERNAAAKAVDEFKDLAQVLLDDGDLAGAIDVCTKAAEAGVDDPDIKRLKAQALESSGNAADALDLYLEIFHTFDSQNRHDDAEEAISRAIDIDSERPDLRQTLAEFYLRANRTQDAIVTLTSLLGLHEKAGRHQDIIAAAAAILDLNPGDIRVRLRHAGALRDVGRPADAVREYHQAARQHQENRETGEAVSVYRTILDIDSDDLDALRQAATLTLQLSGPEDARPYYNRQIEVLKILEDNAAIESLYAEMIGLYPRQHSLRRELAGWLIDIGRKEEGVQYLLGLAEDFQNFGELDEVAFIYEQLTELDPDDQRFVEGLEETYRASGNVERAVQLCQRQVELAGNDAKRAITWLRRLAELDPQSVEHCQRLAEALESGGKKKDAIECYRRLVALHEQSRNNVAIVPVLEKLLTLTGEDAALRLKLAQVLEQSSQTDEACMNYLLAVEYLIGKKKFDQAREVADKVTELDRTSINAWKALIKCHGALGHTAELKQAWMELSRLHQDLGENGLAIECYEQLRQLDAGDAAVGESLAALYEKSGEKDKAFEEYRRVSRVMMDEGSNEGALRLLQRMKQLRTADLDTRRNIIILLEKEGHLLESGDEALSLARVQFQQKNDRDAITVVRRAVQFYDDRYEKHFDAYDMLMEFDRESEALALLLSSAQQAAENKEPSVAVRFIERGLKLDENNRPFREFKIRLLLAAGDAPGATAEYIWLARTALAADDIKEAEHFLAECIKIDPTGIEPHQLLADALQRLNRPGDAAREYRKIVDLAEAAGNRPLAIEYNLKLLEADPANLDIRERLAKLFLQNNQQSIAIEQFMILAGQLQASRDMDRARDVFHQVLRFDSSNLDCRMQLASLEWGAGRLDEARTQATSIITLLEKLGRTDDIAAQYVDLISRDPGYLKWRALYAQFLAANDRNDDAAAQLTELVALLQKQNRLEEALQYLAELELLMPDSPQIPLQMGQINERLDDHSEAYLMYCRAAELFQSRRDIEATLAAYHAALRLKPGDEAALTSLALLLEGEKRTGEAVEAYLQLARQYGGLKDSERQIDTYEKILTLDPGHISVLETFAVLCEKENNIARASEIYISLGRRHEEESDTEQAIGIYKHLKVVNPDLFDTHERLIAIYKKLGRSAEAKAELRELAQLHHQMGDMAQAEQCYMELKSLDPADTATLELLSKFYESTGEMPKAVQTYFDLAAQYGKTGQVDKAIGVYQRIRTLDEDNIDVAIHLFDLHEKKKNWNALWTETEHILDHYFTLNDLDQMDRWSERLHEACPHDMALHLKLADVFQRFNLFDRALEVIRKCAAAEIENKRYKEAINICNHGLGIDARHTPLRQLLAETYLIIDAKREAIRQFEEIARIALEDNALEDEEKALRAIFKLDDSHTPALRRLGDLLIAGGRVDEAVETLSTLSTLYQMENKTADAIQAYQDVLKLQPANQTIRESLAELYLLDRNASGACGEYFTLAANARQQDDFIEARQYLEKVIDISGDNIDAYRQLLDIVPPKEDLTSFIGYGLKLAHLFRAIPALSDAAAVLERILTHDPDNTAVMEDLADILVQSENNEPAGRLYKRLGLAAHKAGDDKKARRHLEMMLSLNVEDPGCLHKLGGIYERLKEPALAAETLGRAADIYTDQQNHTEAVIVLQELISVRGDSPQIYEKYAQLLIKIDDRAGAANQYALAAEIHEQKGQVREAIAALELMFELDEHRLEERLKYAGLLARAGRQGQAIEQYHLASRLYEGNNQIPAALNSALLAIKADRDNPASHRRAFDLYVRLGETAEALDQAHWLAAHFLKANDLEAAEDIIRLGMELDDDDFALHIKLAALHKQSGRTDEASQEFLRSAELAIISRKMDAAIECLQEAKSLQPDNAILMRHLARLYLDEGRRDDYQAEMTGAINLLLSRGMVEDVTELTAEMKGKLGSTPELLHALAVNFDKQGDPILASQEYANLARQLTLDEQFTRALDAVERAINLQPDNLPALETKLDILTAQNRNYEAFPILKTLAGIYQRLERWKDAEAALLQLHELGPNDPVPLKMLVEFYSLRGQKLPLQERLHELGHLFQDSDQIQEAVEAYGRLKNAFPDDIKALSTFVDLYAQIGSEHEILDDYVHLAELFSKSGAVMEATKIFERIMQLDSSSTTLREKFISFLLANGQKTRAINEMFEFARHCLDANQFREAQRILRQAANLEPDDPQVYIQLAEAESRANSRGSALLNLQKAVKLLREERDDNAILDVFDRIIALDRGDIDTRRERLNMLVDLSRTEEAIEAALELADVYIRREFYDLAEELYLQIIEWNPQNHKTWTDLVQIREILGHHDDMLKDYMRWADISLEAGDVEKALQCLKKVTELDTDNVEALRRYIDLYMSHGMEEELVEPYLKLADLHSRRSEFDEAGKIFKRVVELDPANARAQTGLTSTNESRQKDLERKGYSPSEAEKVIWGEAGRPGPAPKPAPRVADSLDAVIANYRNILELNPDNAQVRVKLAEVLEEKGELDAAVTEYLAASAVMVNGDPGRAKSLCEKVLQLRPANKIARERLDKTVKKTDLFKALESAIDESRVPVKSPTPVAGRATPKPGTKSTTKPGTKSSSRNKPIAPGSSAPLTPQPNPLDSDIDEHHDDESELDV